MVERLAEVLEKLVKERELKTTLDVLESERSGSAGASLSASHPCVTNTGHQSQYICDG